MPTGKSLGLAEETTSTDRRTGPPTVKAVTRKGLTVDYQVTWAPLNVPHAERAILIEVDQQRPSRTG